MFASTLIVAALASTVVKAAPLNARAKPSNYATGYLESYDVYHARYLNLDCPDQHNTTFFDDCCHPLLSTETLADKPSYCTPNATQIASASALNATATATATDDGEVSSEFAQATASLDSVFSSVAAATATSTSSDLTVANGYAAPTTTSTYSAPAQTTAASSGGGSAQTGGFATYFYQGGNPGACGNYNSDSGLGIAIDANGWWPNYNSGGPSDHCGKWITITNTNNGKSVTAQVWDVCPTCTNDNSLDLSVGAFTAIASESDGMVPISWTWA